MHPLHDYVAKQLGERLKARRVVVWYDHTSEFLPFIAELRGAPRCGATLTDVLVGSMPARLTEFDGSFLELRALVEPLVAVESPEPLVIYLPGMKPNDASVLMELEKAGGEPYKPALTKLARFALRQRYTDGVIDEKLASEHVTYEDLARMASDDSGESPSLLRAIFPEVPTGDAMVAAWLASDDHDAEIVAKGATSELTKLVHARLALELATPELAKLRSGTLRYVLGNEFRADLRAPAPSSLEGIPAPKTKVDEAAVRAFAHRLRKTHADRYSDLADGVEAQLGLAAAKIPAESLGAIDTFRFEERALLAYCAALVAERRFQEALAIVAERQQSFWLDRDLERRAQWEAMRLMAEVGALATAVRAEVGKLGSDARAWVRAYADEAGWFRLDQAQRRLESWVARLDDDPDEKALGIVRHAYADVCQRMAEGFTRALVDGEWQIPGELRQTHVYDDVVAARPKPVAYFLVDAMRYEMGAELRERLPSTAEVVLAPAIAALPSITPMGMAALHPGAAASYAVVAEKGKLGARIDGVFLENLSARQKFFAARVTNLVDLGLPELLALPQVRLAKKLEPAQVIVVRSQDIDLAGETGVHQARTVMDAVLSDVARAVLRLAKAGVEHFVISADHGHLFFPSDRDASMRVDSPGGDQIDLHRRCWIGRGGATPPGCVRVSATQLGYASSDLDFVFPGGSAIFKAGGDAAFHHGGPTLQELVVPVLTVRLKLASGTATSTSKISITNVVPAISNRIFTAVIEYREQLSIGRASVGPTPVRPMLMAGGKSVGEVGMVVGGDLDRATGCVLLAPGTPVTIAFRLIDDSATSLRIVVLDPTSDVELYRSPADIPVQLGL